MPSVTTAVRLGEHPAGAVAQRAGPGAGPARAGGAVWPLPLRALFTTTGGPLSPGVQSRRRLPPPRAVRSGSATGGCHRAGRRVVLAVGVDPIGSRSPD